MKFGKVWGSTTPVIATPLFELHLLHVKANACCSMHAHRFKHNAFVVVSGELTIEVQKNDYALVDVTHLKAGEVTSVPPTEYHRFKSGPHGCVAYEIYYTEPLSNDIIRRDVGSLLGRKKARHR